MLFGYPDISASSSEKQKSKTRFYFCPHIMEFRDAPPDLSGRWYTTQMHAFATHVLSVCVFVRTRVHTQTNDLCLCLCL